MSTAGGSKGGQDSPEESPAFASYDAALKALVEWTASAEQELTNWELELALNGSWKRWSARQSAGTVFEFSAAMFLECDDEIVRGLERARLELVRVIQLSQTDGHFH